jgi:hypothetical protein
VTSGVINALRGIGVLVDNLQIFASGNKVKDSSAFNVMIGVGHQNDRPHKINQGRVDFLHDLRVHISFFVHAFLSLELINKFTTFIRRLMEYVALFNSPVKAAARRIFSFDRLE